MSNQLNYICYINYRFYVASLLAALN